MAIQSLKKLALLRAHLNPVEISSSEFASHIDSSPQTAARRLKSLEDKKLITRQFLPEGQVIAITKTGIDVLNREYYEYQDIFSGNGSRKVLNGHVITGLGEGKYYISLEGYMSQFRQKLGFDPFPGTLNIRLDKNSIELRKRIYPGIRISGFTDHNRTFGSGSCFNVIVNAIQGAVIIPERTHYPEDIIEVIAPVNLREHLDFKDGSKVRVEVPE